MHVVSGGFPVACNLSTDRYDARASPHRHGVRMDTVCKGAYQILCLAGPTRELQIDHEGKHGTLGPWVLWDETFISFDSGAQWWDNQRINICKECSAREVSERFSALERN